MYMSEQKYYPPGAESFRAQKPVEGETGEASEQINPDELVQNLEQQVARRTTNDEYQMSPASRNLLTRFASSEQITQVVEDIRSDLARPWEAFGTTDEDEIKRLLAIRYNGRVFEELALLTLPEEEHAIPQLESFLLEALRDPHMWDIDAETLDNLQASGEISFKDVLNYNVKRPKSEEDFKSLRNNDALRIAMTTDDAGEPVAVITGVVEAKNHTVGGHQRDYDQMREAPRVLHRMVKKYQDVVPLIVKAYKMEGVPEHIDIVDLEDFEYVIVSPEDTEQPESLTGYNNCTFQDIPVRKMESDTLARMLIEQVRSA